MPARQGVRDVSVLSKEDAENLMWGKEVADVRSLSRHAVEMTFIHIITLVKPAAMEWVFRD